jgi:hypothetical protein
MLCREEMAGLCAPDGPADPMDGFISDPNAPPQQSISSAGHVQVMANIEFLEDIPGDKEFYHSYVRAMLSLVARLLQHRPSLGLCCCLSCQRNKDHLSRSTLFE